MKGLEWKWRILLPYIIFDIYCLVRKGYSPLRVQYCYFIIGFPHPTPGFRGFWNNCSQNAQFLLVSYYGCRTVLFLFCVLQSPCSVGEEKLLWNKVNEGALDFPAYLKFCPGFCKSQTMGLYFRSEQYILLWRLYGQAAENDNAMNGASVVLYQLFKSGRNPKPWWSISPPGHWPCRLRTMGVVVQRTMVGHQLKGNGPRCISNRCRAW